MTRQSVTATVFHPAPLASSLALLWSGMTLAVPGEPVLDWIETEYVVGESADAAQVPVGWTRHYGGLALTAQYWLNDELVLTRAVDADDQDLQSGSATLTIDTGGTHEITVALCDTEGCTASEPMPVNVVDPGRPLRASSANNIDEEMLSYEQAAQTVQAIAAELANAPAGLAQTAAAANQSWGGWFASFVGQAALKHGLAMGFDGLVELIGLSPDHPDLAAEFAGINQSLGELKHQLDEISRKIDVGKADSDFKNSHRAADVAMQNIMSIAGYIAAAEAGTATPTEQQLQDWALANSTNLSSLRSLLTNSLTGAIPLLLDYYQLKYPVSTGIEVRDEVDGYLDGFRAALGVALINQAWLSEIFAPNELYNAQAELDARATVVAAYDMTGAPYPQPPSSPPRFIHRIGNDWALVDGDRQVVGSQEKGRVPTQDRNQIWGMYSAIAAGVNAPGAMTISDYMDTNGVRRHFQDPNSVRRDHRDSFFECEYWVRHDELYVGGNSAHITTHTTYNKKYFCLETKPYHEVRKHQAALERQLRENERVWKIDVPTNAWGMPALVDERAVRGFRDGIQVDSIARDQGNAVTVNLQAEADLWMQLHDPETGSMLTSPVFLGQSPQTFSNLQAPTGAIEIRLGYGIGQSSDGDMVTLERTLVTANPGKKVVDLTVDPS
jgi:hypothetical protein